MYYKIVVGYQNLCLNPMFLTKTIAYVLARNSRGTSCEHLVIVKVVRTKFDINLDKSTL